MRGPMLPTGEEKHAMYIHNWENTDLTHEPAYNVRAQRLPKFAEADESYAGGAWVVVAPDTTMTEHVNPDGEPRTRGGGTRTTPARCDCCEPLPTRTRR